MKKLLLLFLSIFCLIGSPKASHIVGGEISWECLNNGKFVFYLSIYRDCTGIPFNFSNTTLDIAGSPLPRNASNATLSSIIMRPDSNAWISGNYGDMSPDCGNPGLRLGCSNADAGALQQFLFKSDPLTLKGIPPAKGWSFNYTAPCCRPNVENLAAAGSALLSAVMFGNGNAVDTCYDSSPKFAQAPDYVFCRAQLATGQYTSIDPNGDSLVYRLDSTFNSPYTVPTYVGYVSPYSYNYPLPDTSINSSNVDLDLNSRNGWFYFETHNGSGFEKYWVAAQVDAYRNGRKLSSTHREMPIIIADCPAIDSVNNTVNTAPKADLPFSPQNIPDTSVVAGSLLSFTVQITENQPLASSVKQEVTRRYYGASLSNVVNNPTNCPNPSDTACAVFVDSVSFNSVAAVFESKKRGSDIILFNWQTDCNDLGPGKTAKTHYFTVRLADDFCPIPAISYKVFSITVLPDSVLCGITTTIAEQDLESTIRIYPNPSNGLLNIDRSIKENLSLEIYDLQGRLIRTENLIPSQSSIQLPEQNGVYLIKLSRLNGEQASFKIFKN